jgi:stage V sporulation protein G
MQNNVQGNVQNNVQYDAQSNAQYDTQNNAQYDAQNTMQTPETKALPMKIAVTAYPVNDSSGTLKARAMITLNDSIIISGVRVMQGKEGLFAAMPSQKGADGKYYKVCRPATPEVGEMLNRVVLGAYQAMLLEQAHAQKYGNSQSTLQHGEQQSAPQYTSQQSTQSTPEYAQDYGEPLVVQAGYPAPGFMVDVQMM